MNISIHISAIIIYLGLIAIPSNSTSRTIYIEPISFHLREVGCRDDWDTKSCQSFAETKGHCSLSSPFAHIAKLCRKTCGLCGGGGSGGETSPVVTSTTSKACTTTRGTVSTDPVPVKTTTTRKVTTTRSPQTGSTSGGGSKSDTSGDHCPKAQKYGSGPPSRCPKPTDPQNRPKSGIESWFTREMFNDLFPKANIGHGPVDCWPFNYDAFVIAARYFPRFGTESPNSVYSKDENHRRDIAAFLSHVIQETGENDPSLYRQFDKEKADNCFYRGGFFNWFEGGPTSAFLDRAHPGHHPNDSKVCNLGGRYCAADAVNNAFYPCNNEKEGALFKGCYFGRGAIQISYNFNYGLFSQWLNEQGVTVDLLNEPWQVMEKQDPPISIMASIWFYMTPQPPKPAMHDIVMGVWEPGTENRAAGYEGPIFGPTSLVINNECNGEDEETPGGGGESRRIKAFKWFAKYFGFPVGPEKTLSCKNMKKRLGEIKHNKSYGPDWSSTWKAEACQCSPVSYAGPIPYYQEGFYPKVWVDRNQIEKARCEKILKSNPKIFQVDPANTECLKHM